jgi:hypothetical protein
MATATTKRRINRQTSRSFLTKWKSYLSKRMQKFTIKNTKKKHKTTLDAVIIETEKTTDSFYAVTEKKKKF